MSADKAEFVFDGDATKAVSELYRLEEAYKRVKAEIKKGTQETSNDADTWLSKITPLVRKELEIAEAKDKQRQVIKTLQAAQKNAHEERIRQHQQENVYQLQELDHYRLMSTEIEQINHLRLFRMDAARKAQLEREHAQNQAQLALTAAFARQLQATEIAAGRLNAGLSGSAGASNIFRNSMTQVAYGVGDVMSVTGGLAERVRASANNLQYMAMMIPGPWGIAINVLTLAAQAGTILWTSMDKGTETTARHIEQVKTLAEYYKKLSEDVDKARVGEEAFGETQRANEFLKNIAPQTRRMDEIRAQQQALDTQIAPLAKDMEYYDKNNLTATKERRELKRLKDHRESLKTEYEILSADVKKLTDLDRQNEENIRKQNRLKDVEKRISGASTEMQAVYEKDRMAMGEEAAKAALQKRIAAVLPEHLRGAATGAASNIAAKAESDLYGKQLKELFGGKSESQKKLEAVERDIALKRIEKEELHIQNRADGRISPLEHQAEQKVQDAIDALDVFAKKLRMVVDDDKNQANVNIAQRPIQQLPKQPNRNGNN